MVQFFCSLQVVGPQHQRGHVSMQQHPETELGKSFSLMANFPDASASAGGSSAHHPPVSPSAFHAAHSSSSMDDFHQHHQRASSYADPYDRMHHHSSSSSNSLAFSPTELYSPTHRHSGGQQLQSPVASHHRGNNGSRSMDPVARDTRQMAGANLTSPTFHQPVQPRMLFFLSDHVLRKHFHCRLRAACFRLLLFQLRQHFSNHHWTLHDPLFKTAGQYEELEEE